MVEHPKCARCGLTITQFHVCPVRETPLERQHRDLSPIPLYPSESPTHPDAPRAGGETPVLYCAECGYHPVIPPGQLGEICAWCQRDGYRIKLVSSFIASAGPSPERASK